MLESVSSAWTWLMNRPSVPERSLILMQRHHTVIVIVAVNLRESGFGWTPPAG